MPLSDPLPEVFAIQRRTSPRRVLFQLLDSQYNTLEDYYTISDFIPPGRNIYSLESKSQPDYHDRFVNKIHMKHPYIDAIIEVNYWTLPYIIRNHGGAPIPVVEFQYRSWIPTTPRNYLSIHMPYGSNDFLRVTETIQYERLETICIEEDKYDYRRRLQEHESRRWELADLRDRNTRLRQREVHIETRTVERIVIKPQTLPKSVGDILLASARKGEDSCPISTTPFASCKRLCVTSCFHIFENESLVKWNETNSKCPVCRSMIENVVSEDK
jgi:hypothetical protein